MNRQIALLVFATVTLAGCAVAPQQSGNPAPVEDLASGPSGPQPQTAEPKPAPSIQVPEEAKHEQSAGAYLSGDGPGEKVPANLDNIPDAIPKAEPLHRYANLPYTRFGVTYTPLKTTGTYKEEGMASWYGKKFHGQLTSIGDVYDMYGMTASHTTLPVPSYARVTNVVTGKSVIVRVNDRGPFLHDRIIDLSYAAAHKLGIINNGTAKVLVESISVENTEPLTLSAVVSAPVKSAPIPVEPASVVVAPVATPEPSPVPKAKSNKGTGNVYLQLGAFKSGKAANSFLAKMHKKLGAEGKLLSVFQQNKFHQVLLGPFATLKKANAVSKIIKTKHGVKSSVNVHN